MLLRLFSSLDEREAVSALISSFLAVQKYSIFGLAKSGLMELKLRKTFSKWKVSFEDGKNYSNLYSNTRLKYYCNPKKRVTWDFPLYLSSLVHIYIKMAIILPTGQWYAPSTVINDAWYCMVLHCIARYCMVLHDIAWYCMVLHGIACMVLQGIAGYCILDYLAQSCT